MKISDKLESAAKKIFADNPKFKQLFVTKKGEFFTDESLARASVDDPKKEISNIKNASYVEVEKPTAPNAKAVEAAKTEKSKLKAAEKRATDAEATLATEKTLKETALANLAAENVIRKGVQADFKTVEAKLKKAEKEIVKLKAAASEKSAKN